MSQSVSFDEGFEAPEFHKEGLQKCCINTAKGAKVNGNDTSCSNNCEKLYAECERLSEIAKKKNTIINQRRKEYERFMREKKNFEDEKKKGGNSGAGSGISETDMKAKDAEIAYLEAQLRKKEEENVKLKKDIERVVTEQMKTLEKMKEADQSFLGNNNDNIDMLNQQILELKKENSVMQYQLNRAEREKSIAVQDAVAAQVMKQGTRTNTGAEISDDQLRNAMDSTYDIQKKVYYAFNKDLKKRLDFISNLIEWDEWADVLIDNEDRNTQARNNRKRMQQTPRVKDGELASEHWAASKSELAQIMMKVYFPVIDVQEHDQIVGKEDLAIKMETEKIHDTIAVELITLQNIMNMLGGQNDPQNKKFVPFTLTETQKNIIAGLMQRLFYQLPAYEPGTIGKERQRSNDFQVQVTNFYLLLQKRISLKQVFQASLDVNMTKQTSDIDTLTEQVMSTICDFEAFCEIEESQIEVRRKAPVAVHDLFQKKIFEKMMKLQQANPDNNISLSNLGLNNSAQLMGSGKKRGNFSAYEQSPQSSR